MRRPMPNSRRSLNDAVIADEALGDGAPSAIRRTTEKATALPTGAVIIGGFRSRIASPRRWRGPLAMLAAAGAAIGGWAGLAEGAPPVPLRTAPTAVRGGIVAIPLQLPAEGEGLPADVPVLVRDGDLTSEIVGRVIWLATPLVPAEPRWTRSANPTVVRSIEADVDPRTLLRADAPGRVRSVDAALLLVDVPEVSATATLTIDSTVVSPAWIDPGPSLAIGSGDVMIDPELGASWADDRPDPESPFEWFRWTLVADAHGERVPAPPGDAASQLFARHVAELWLAGIARVERQSEGVADAIRQWLTATSRRPGTGADGASLATWLADPNELGSLLAILLDRSRDDQVVMNAALAWMDARTPLLTWIESDIGGTVRVMLANPMSDELVVRAQWLGENLAPLATLIPPRTIERLTMERPTGRIAGPDATEAIILAIQADNLARRYPFSPRSVRAKPPSLSFGTFVPALTLADVQAGRVGAAPVEWATTASLRRRGGRWELFAECLAPKGAPREDRFGVEIAGRRISVLRDGTVEGDADALLEANVREYEDRWRLRLTLPDGWLPRPGSIGAIVTMGLRRDAGTVRTTAVLPRAAFEERTPLVEIDLSTWSDGVPAAREE